MVLPGVVHPVRNSSRCDSKPSGALDPAELFQNVTLLQPPAQRASGPEGAAGQHFLRGKYHLIRCARQRTLPASQALGSSLDPCLPRTVDGELSAHQWCNDLEKGYVPLFSFSTLPR